MACARQPHRHHWSVRVGAGKMARSATPRVGACIAREVSHLFP